MQLSRDYLVVPLFIKGEMIMNEHIQVALFFPEQNIYDPTKLANAFLEAFPELGQPVILPFNIGPNQDDSDIPVAFFDQSSEIKLSLTFNNLVITLFNDKRNEKKDIIKKLFSLVSNFGLSFSRIGYINNKLMPESKVSAFKENKFKDKSIINAEEFQLAWFDIINIDNLTVNYWQRFNTNKLLTNDIFVSYDLNTLNEEKHNVDYDFAINFIDSVDTFLSE